MKKAKIFLTLAAFLVVVWFVFNPIGYFGVNSFGFTVYNSLPLPIMDFQVRADGKMRVVSKTHDLMLDDVGWLLADNPAMLIVSIGWQNVVIPRREWIGLKGVDVQFLQTGEAIERFNELKRTGKRVAIHLHSTC